MRFEFIISFKEKEEINNQKLCVDESLCELKECKRAVEIRYKNILSDMAEQSLKCETLVQKNKILESSNRSLDQKLKNLESEKSEHTEIMAEMQQNLILKSSEYESQIRNMQIELGNRLDEINVVQKEDVDKVKGHYRELFQEKASEVMVLREEAERLNLVIDDYKTKVKDLEYREEELNNIVNKMREGNLLNRDQTDLEKRLSETLQNSQELQDRVNLVSGQFKIVEEDSKQRLKQFDFHIQELKQIISDKDIEINQLKSNQKYSDQDNTQNFSDSDSKSVNSSLKVPNCNSNLNNESPIKYKNRRRRKKSKNNT